MESGRKYNSFRFCLVSKDNCYFPAIRHSEGEHQESGQTWLSGGLPDTRSYRVRNWQMSGRCSLAWTGRHTDLLSGLGKPKVTRLLVEPPWKPTPIPFGLLGVPFWGRQQGICSQARIETGSTFENVGERPPPVRLFRSRLRPCQVDRVPVE